MTTGTTAPPKEQVRTISFRLPLERMRLSGGGTIWTGDITQRRCALRDRIARFLNEGWTPCGIEVAQPQRGSDKNPMITLKFGDKPI